MKQLYLLLLPLLTPFGLISQTGGEIVNGGFESWSTSSIYELPTDWISSNTDEYRGVSLINKDTDAFDGSFSARLDVDVVGGDTLFGYVLHGSLGMSGPDGGIPYTSTCDGASVHVKSNLLGTDTLYALIIKFSGGSSVSFDLVPVADGTNSTWTQVDFSFSNVAQDELFFGFVVGDPFGSEQPTPGSWAMVDKVVINNGTTPTTALPNDSFETWDDVSVENPDNWYTLNENFASLGICVEQSGNAYSGSYAAKVKTLSTGPGGDTIPGFLSLGQFDLNASGAPFIASPYIHSPTTFSGAYEYDDNNNDEAAIMIQFYKAGALVGGHNEILTPNSGYETFSSSLTITDVPDSIIFVVFSGDNPSSVLYVDDLNFTGGNVGLTEMLNEALFDVYPNPATTIVTVKANTSEFYNWSLYDVSGKLIERGENAFSTHQLSVSELEKGSYLLRIEMGNKIKTEKIIIE